MGNQARSTETATISEGKTRKDIVELKCQLMMKKILSAQIKEIVYDSLLCSGLYLEEKKGCRREIRGTCDLLYIDQHILKETETRRKM